MKYRDRVRVTCVPSGTGDIILSTAPLGYRTFDEAGYIDGDETDALIVVPITGEWETCRVVYNSGVPSITRGTIYGSSNSDNRVSFAGGSAGVVAIGLSGIIAEQTFDDYAAAGTTQGTATALTTNDCYITSGGADTGVVLSDTDAMPVGWWSVIVNQTATRKVLYPDSGSKFNATGSTDNGTYLDPGQSIRVRRTDVTLWQTS